MENLETDNNFLVIEGATSISDKVKEEDSSILVWVIGKETPSPTVSC